MHKHLLQASTSCISISSSQKFFCHNYSPTHTVLATSVQHTYALLHDS